MRHPIPTSSRRVLQAMEKSTTICNMFQVRALRIRGGHANLRHMDGFEHLRALHLQILAGPQVLQASIPREHQGTRQGHCENLASLLGSEVLPTNRTGTIYGCVDKRAWDG